MQPLNFLQNILNFDLVLIELSKELILFWCDSIKLYL